MKSVYGKSMYRKVWLKWLIPKHAAHYGFLGTDGLCWLETDSWNDSQSLYDASWPCGLPLKIILIYIQTNGRSYGFMDKSNIDMHLNIYLPLKIYTSL